MHFCITGIAHLGIDIRKRANRVGQNAVIVMPKNHLIIPGLLLLLCAVPLGAGAYRMMTLVTSTGTAPESARFFDNPVPVVVHVMSLIVYCVFGTFQFAPGLRLRRTISHRVVGWIVAPCGVLSAFSGIWLTLVYPPVENDSMPLTVLRLAAGVAMLAFIMLGLNSIVRRNLVQHRNWMMRGFAIASGVGTQAYLVILWVLLMGDDVSASAKVVLFGAGWGVNLATVEWIVRNQQTPAHVPIR